MALDVCISTNAHYLKIYKFIFSEDKFDSKISLNCIKSTSESKASTNEETLLSSECSTETDIPSLLTRDIIIKLPGLC